MMQLPSRTLHLIAGAIVAGSIMVAGTGPAKAQQQQTPAVSSFLASPEQLLRQNPDAGPQLSNAVQSLALADTSTFKILIGLTATASDQQKAAIGAGLAQATKIEVLTNQALAAEWQQQIAAITDASFKTAATNAFGDVKLGAVGGGAIGAAGAGLGGPGNGPTSAGGSAPESIRSGATPTLAFTVTSSTNSGSSGSVSP